MEFQELLCIVGDEPLFETGLLLAGDVDPDNVRRQLSRWTAAGKLYQLRRGLYALAPPYQKVKPHPFLVANRLVQASYVSLEAALAHYGLIPEHVPLATSVGTARPAEYKTPLGRYAFRHVKLDLLCGYQRRAVGPDGQRAVSASDDQTLKVWGISTALDTGLRAGNASRPLAPSGRSMPVPSRPMARPSSRATHQAACTFCVWKGMNH